MPERLSRCTALHGACSREGHVSCHAALASKRCGLSPTWHSFLTLHVSSEHHLSRRVHQSISKAESMMQENNRT